MKPTIHYTNNVWQDDELMTVFGFPYKTVKFLTQQVTTTPPYPPQGGNQDRTNIFNTYSWGGYLIWTMPNYLYFADGRSAATWTDRFGKLILQKHLDYMTERNKLLELEQKGVSYIILQQNYAPYRQLKWYDKIFFDNKDVNKTFEIEPAQIYTDLKNSPNWTKIYEDKVSIVWQRATP